MYAVIEMQGSQFRVEKNDTIVVNRMSDVKDKKVKVDKVLFGKKGSSYYVGSPYVKGAYVECNILRDIRLKKVIAFKYRDRKSSQSKKGHRQDVTEVKIKDIHFGDTEKNTENKEKKETKIAKEIKTAKKAKAEKETKPAKTAITKAKEAKAK